MGQTSKALLRSFYIVLPVAPNKQLVNVHGYRW